MGATGACWKVAGGWKEVGEVPRVLLVLSWLLLAQLMGSTGSSTLVGACAAPSAVTAITGESKFREKQAEEIERGLASLSLEILDHFWKQSQYQQQVKVCCMSSLVAISRAPKQRAF